MTMIEGGRTIAIRGASARHPSVASRTTPFFEKQDDMAYDKTTKRLYVDTANNRGITPWEVAQCIGDYRTAAHGRDVGMLCSSPKINMWAKHKPVRHSTKGLLSDIDGGYKGADGDCGIVPASLSSADLNTLYSGVLPSSWISDQSRGWTLKLPRGLDSGEPHRLYDFDEYMHGSRPPFYRMVLDGKAVLDQYSTMYSLIYLETFLLQDSTLTLYADASISSEYMNWSDIMSVVGDMYAGVIAVRKPRLNTIPAPGSTSQRMFVGERMSDKGYFSVPLDLENWAVGFNYYLHPVFWEEDYDDSVAIADRVAYALPDIPLIEVYVTKTSPTIYISEGEPVYSHTVGSTMYYTIEVTVKVKNPSQDGALSLVSNTATVSGSLMVAQTYDLDDAEVASGPAINPDGSVTSEIEISTFTVTLPKSAANSHTVAVSLNGGEYTESKDFNWLLS